MKEERADNLWNFNFSQLGYSKMMHEGLAALRLQCSSDYRHLTENHSLSYSMMSCTLNNLIKLLK